MGSLPPKNSGHPGKYGRMTQRVLVVIPAFNEERSIGQVLESLQETVPTFGRIVVNDGSTDNTSHVLSELGEKELRLSENLGYGRAIQAGIKYALIKEYDVIVTFDADGQHRPVDVPGVVNALYEKNADMVIGSRFSSSKRYEGPLDRRIGQVLFSLLTPVLIGKRIYDTSSGFKAITSDAAREIINGSFMDFHIETMMRLNLLDFKIDEHPIVVEERQHGTSMHSAISVIIYPLKTMLHVFVTLLDIYLSRTRRKK
jgi:glycosyltransferase involved in cell wall biosynthesis